MRDFSFWTYKRLLAVLRCPALVAACSGVPYDTYESTTISCGFQMEYRLKILPKFRKMIIFDGSRIQKIWHL